MAEVQKIKKAKVNRNTTIYLVLVEVYLIWNVFSSFFQQKIYLGKMVYILKSEDPQLFVIAQTIGMLFSLGTLFMIYVLNWKKREK